MSASHLSISTFTNYRSPHLKCNSLSWLHGSYHGYFITRTTVYRESELLIKARFIEVDSVVPRWNMIHHKLGGAFQPFFEPDSYLLKGGVTVSCMVPGGVGDHQP